MGNSKSSILNFLLKHEYTITVKNHGCGISLIYRIRVRLLCIKQLIAWIKIRFFNIILTISIYFTNYNLWQVILMSIKDVVNKFNEFLSDHSALQVSNNSLITHTNICGGKYIISKEDFKELAKLIVEIYGISKAQDISIPEMANFHIVEKPTSLTNLHIDFDIKCKAGTTEHVYRELPNFVDMFISCMNQSIMQVFELDSADLKDKYLTCYVLEREALVNSELFTRKRPARHISVSIGFRYNFVHFGGVCQVL